MHYLQIYLLAALILAALWFWGIKPRLSKLFVIKLTPGRVQVKQGEPPSSFVEECGLIARHQTVQGYIYARKGPRGVTLAFSASIDADVAQQFRNVFPYELYARPGGRGGGPGAGGQRRA